MEKNQAIILKTQIELTINELKSKVENDWEPNIDIYLEKYIKALKVFSHKSVDLISASDFNYLKNSARGYLETSSNWSQVFLDEMGKTEEILKKIN